jgi:chromate transporter
MHTHIPANPVEPPATLAPASPSALFWACTRLAMQGFGGVLPVAQRELVDRLRWLTAAEFLALLSVAQVLPGPNIVNLGLMLGDRWFGWRGALAACTGLLLAPLVVVLLLAAAALQWQHLAPVAGALRGMGVVAAALVLSTAYKLATGVRPSALGLPAVVVLASLTVLALAVLRWPLPAVVLGLGGAAVALAAWRLKDAHQQPGPGA